MEVFVIFLGLSLIVTGICYIRRIPVRGPAPQDKFYIFIGYIFVIWGILTAAIGLVMIMLS